MHTMRRGRPHLTSCVLVVLALATIAVPSRAAAVPVSDEAELRAAVNDSDVSEVVITADVSLTTGHLAVPPSRNLTLRGACGADNASPCTLDAHSLSRHLHVQAGATVRVTNMHLVNGSAITIGECSPFSKTPGNCVPDYWGFGVWLGLLRTFTGLTEALNSPSWGDKVREASLPLPLQWLSDRAPPPPPPPPSSPPPLLLLRMSIHTRGKSCFDLGQVFVFNSQ